MKLRAQSNEAIDVGQRQAGIVQRLDRQISYLLQVEHARRVGVFFRSVLRSADQRRLPSKSHAILFVR